MSRVLLALILSAGCAGAEEEEAACTAPDLLPQETMQATVDDAGWSTTGVGWNWSGSSIQITTPAADGWRFTIVALTITEGVTPEDATLPFDVTLDGDGGWAVAYSDAGESYSSEDGSGGSLTVTEITDSELYGCVSFGAADASGSVAVEDGAIRAWVVGG